MLDAIRARFPPPIVFHIDCNGGYDLKHDYEFLCAAQGCEPVQERPDLVRVSKLGILVRSEVSIECLWYRRRCHTLIFRFAPGCQL